jgi:hypothetical protein
LNAVKIVVVEHRATKSLSHKGNFRGFCIVEGG